MASSPKERLALLRDAGPVDQDLVAMARDGERVIGESPMPDGPRIDFEAANLRRERTGIHAKVSISAVEQVLNYDTFNIERSEERRKLAVGAAAALGNSKEIAQSIRRRLDQFCEKAWDCYIEATVPDLRRGSDQKAANILLKPYLTDSRSILFAPGGAAKSWLALIWSLCLHHGLSFPWSAPVARPVLWIDFEDTPDVFDSRLRQAARILGCPDELPAYHFEGRRLVDVFDPIKRHLASEDYGLIVVDSISRLGLGKLNDDSSANTSTDMLNRLEVPWLALGHTAREGGEHVFGSSHFEFGARVVIKGTSATNPYDDGLVALRLEVTKANHIRRGQVTTWAFRFVDDELVEHRLAAAGEFPDLSDTRPIREKVRDYLGHVESADLSEIIEWTEGSDRSVRRALLDGEGSDFERISGGKGRGNKAVWKRREPA